MQHAPVTAKFRQIFVEAPRAEVLHLGARPECPSQGHAVLQTGPVACRRAREQPIHDAEHQYPSRASSIEPVYVAILVERTYDLEDLRVPDPARRGHRGDATVRPVRRGRCPGLLLGTQPRLRAYAPFGPDLVELHRYSSPAGSALPADFCLTPKVFHAPISYPRWPVNVRQSTG